ncbi:uncharacterized protein N7459_004441 [Penicillium hispanicum]|uniref:uncharacterized protein n=1 Tax=Penicillium hispanicum TaxID=1080232 RepID=UPI00253FE109|nr:uncharacterized protein N7459_004441 [Penicillium hispanicum]KAJ5584641.1 hypothetical protein N7459_004441 [Penicillium hispanicum]
MSKLALVLKMRVETLGELDMKHSDAEVSPDNLGDDLVSRENIQANALRATAMGFLALQWRYDVMLGVPGIALQPGFARKRLHRDAMILHGHSNRPSCGFYLSC